MPKTIRRTEVTTEWSVSRVNEAIQMMDEFVNQASIPLEQVRLVAREVRNVDRLPQHVDMSLLRIIGEIDRIIGGSEWETIGRLKAGIQSLRESLPEGYFQDTEKVSHV
jgi:hypothetical protein